MACNNFDDSYGVADDITSALSLALSVSEEDRGRFLFCLGDICYKLNVLVDLDTVLEQSDTGALADFPAVFLSYL